MKFQALLLFVALGTATLTAQYFPSPTEWDHRSPATASLNADSLRAAVTFAKTNEYSGERDLRLAILKSFSREPEHGLKGPTKERGGPAGMVIKDGYIVAEWGDLGRVDMTFSVTKSYLSTTAGLAFDDGLIGGVSELAQDYVWDGTFSGDHNARITWEHLLHQTSDWSGSLFGLQDWADRPDRKTGFDDWRYRQLHAPGTHFKYNDVRVNLLAYSLLQVWRKPLPQVLKERIMDPIGASSTWRWFGYDDAWVTLDGAKMQSVSGGGHHGGGVFINTLDQARMGLLFARKGKWAGKQLISEKWVEMVQTPTPANPNYGYMWWLNRPGPRHWAGVPEHVYYAAGFGGNFIVVDEQRDLVIVTRWLEPSEIGAFVRRVYGAL